jgi:hypothetical protein
MTDREGEMTNLEYDMLTILVQVKVLTPHELQNISDALATPCEEGWGWLIDWLNERPNVEPKLRRRMTIEDYRNASNLLG